MTAIISHNSDIALDFRDKKQEPSPTLLKNLREKSYDVEHYSERLDKTDTDNQTAESSALSAHYNRLEKFVLQRWLREVLPDSRTAKTCLRSIKPDFTGFNKLSHVEQEAALDGEGASSGVPIFSSVAEGDVPASVFYGNLQVCGSVWNCPVCAAKISERRRVELKAALDAHRAVGGVTMMVTRTVPHDKFDDIRQMTKSFKAAERWMKTQADYKGNGQRVLGLKKKLGLIGTITALEVTYGFKNGWHPHTHEILFLEKPYPDMLEDLHALFPLWKKAAVKQGFKEPSIKAFDIQNADFAANYVAKYGHEPRNPIWSEDAEMTQLHRKRSWDFKNFNASVELKDVAKLTPWDLMRLSLYWDVRQADELFKQYVEAFKGHSQLRWSPGLKKRFQIQTKTDEQLAEEQSKQAVQIVNIPSPDWYNVLKYDARGVLLALAKHIGQEGVDDLLEDFRNLELGHSLV